MSICDVNWASRIQPRGEPVKMWRNVAAQTFSAWLAVVLFLQSGCRQYIVRNHHTSKPSKRTRRCRTPSALEQLSPHHLGLMRPKLGKALARKIKFQKSEAILDVGGDRQRLPASTRPR